MDLHTHKQYIKGLRTVIQFVNAKPWVIAFGSFWKKRSFYPKKDDIWKTLCQEFIQMLTYSSLKPLYAKVSTLSLYL